MDFVTLYLLSIFLSSHLRLADKKSNCTLLMNQSINIEFHFWSKMHNVSVSFETIMFTVSSRSASFERLIRKPMNRFLLREILENIIWKCQYSLWKSQRKNWRCHVTLSEMQSVYHQQKYSGISIKRTSMVRGKVSAWRFSPWKWIFSGKLVSIIVYASMDWKKNLL